LGTPVESVISKAYVSEVKVAGTDHVYEPLVCPLAMVETVLRSVEAPFFKVIVTGPEASVHVKVNGEPAVNPLNAELVKETALATASAEAATKRDVNCILRD
jgi:hypothetical protein